MPVNAVSVEIDGINYKLESGKYAKFASGAVMVSAGETMVLVTVVAAKEEREGVDFVPLSVEYREKTASVGKFPGGFLKREGRPSDKEVLTARLIDRPIRPMLPKTWRKETQIVATVYSAEPNIDPDSIAAIGASAALGISNIPFSNLIAEVNVGRIDGEFVLNPSVAKQEESDLYITVAGTEDSIAMVEGESKEMSEDVFLDAMLFAHEKIKQLIDLQKELVSLCGVEKQIVDEKEVDEEIVSFVKETIYSDLMEYVHTTSTKEERTNTRIELKDKLVEAAEEKFGDRDDAEDINYVKLCLDVLSKLEKEEMRAMILKDGKRLDGRKTDEIRPIACEAGLLPRAHGSSLFTRGETQSLTTCTLGTDRDEQMIDGLQPTFTNKFYLHYNFPPFCTGETGRMGVSRREVGHGHLAERALKNMIPDEKEFPYTIRIVSDILESNGSSSMATVCAGSLSLFDAGVPVENAVSGIAMGLIKEGDDYAILSDILGDEDFLGDMDFKVAGTRDGITACQMDIKIDGLPIEIMKQALAQANKGRMHILDIMQDTIDAPREDISEYAPRFTTMSIPTDMIGAVIGSGGETIREISKVAEVEVNIDDDGTVIIAATSAENANMAREMIEKLIRKPEAGEIYEDVEVKEIREGLGAFIEILPKKQGLLHISQIAYERVENVSDYLKVGDRINVKLLDVTPDGKMKLSMKALLEKPEGWEERPPRRDSRPPRNNDRGGRDRRGGNRR